LEQQAWEMSLEYGKYVKVKIIYLGLECFSHTIHHFDSEKGREFYYEI
jgi:hypothetical protein